MDVEDINAYLQRKDAEQLLKRMPRLRSRTASVPAASAACQNAGLAAQSSTSGAGAAA